MKKCLIVVNTDKTQSEILGIDIANFLKERGIEYEFLDFNGREQKAEFSRFDFVVTLGGDGTVLFASRGCAPCGIPVFPVNLGEFGFIAGIKPCDWEAGLEKFLAGKMAVTPRAMLFASVFRSGKTAHEFFALNDIVVSAKSAAKTISLDISANSFPLGHFKADGVIVASSTGSTAYSASAGGPIVDPELNALVLTPLNPFSLSARPIVFGEKARLRIRIVASRNRCAIITVDGQEPFALEDDDEIEIRKSGHDALLAGASVEKFYDALRFKLNWSGGPVGGSHA